MLWFKRLWFILQIFYLFARIRTFAWISICALGFSPYFEFFSRKILKLAFFCSNNQTRFYNPRWQTLTVKARALGTTRDILRKHSCFEKCLPFFFFSADGHFFHFSHGLSVFLKIWKWRASYYFRSRSSLKEKVISTSTVLYICRNISWQHQVYLILLWRSSFTTPPVNESSLCL